MNMNNKKTHNFASIFELEMNENISEKKNLNQEDELPTIYFEVNSVDYWNRHRIEGYGSYNIDINKHINDQDICIPIWRPIGTIREEMTRFFIGGGKRLKDKKLITIPQTNCFNSRVNWNTIQMGNIHLSINIVTIYNQNHIQKTQLIYNEMSQQNKIKDESQHKIQNKSKRRHTHKHKKRKSKLSKLITLEDQDMSDVDNKELNHHQHHKRKSKRKSKLLQKVHLSD